MTSDAVTGDAAQRLHRERESHALIIDRVPGPCEASAQLSIEQALFDALTPTPKSHRLRLWQPLPALIATMAESNLPGFARATALARDRGMPVHVRRSGGGAVCLGPGSLIVSHFHCSPRNDIDASYRWFAGVLTEAAASLNVSLTAEHVAGAYCDGRFDLAWNGLKVGGMAQRRRTQDGRALVWTHAVLAVEAGALRYPELVTEFYAGLGSSRVADPNNTATLSHCLSGHAASHGLSSRVSDAIVRAFEAGTGRLVTLGG